MTRNAHTPGPWTKSRYTRNIVGLVNGSPEVVATIGDMPCIGGHDDLAAERGSDMEHANARLIAAAPELLEALSCAAEHLAAIRAGSDDEAASWELADKCRDAIAKATGATA